MITVGGSDHDDWILDAHLMTNLMSDDDDNYDEDDNNL